MAQPLIVLATDFGITDTYVGVMKGVISYYAPRTQVIDLTHDIRPQDILHGSYSLRVAFPYFPKNTIFVCVVDPGVGTSRGAMAIKASDKYLVMPNNGLCSLILRDYDLQGTVDLSNKQYHLSEVSSTFHGRDIFSPVAAHLATNAPFEDLGKPIQPKDIVRLNQLSNMPAKDGSIKTQVIHIDHFGNCITSIHNNAVLENTTGWKIRAGNTLIPDISRTYGEVQDKEALAYFGSDGFLEVAVRNGHAGQELGIELGHTIELIPAH